MPKPSSAYKAIENQVTFTLKETYNILIVFVYTRREDIDITLKHPVENAGNLKTIRNTLKNFPLFAQP